MAGKYRPEDEKLHPDRKYKGILHQPRASRVREEDLTVHSRKPDNGNPLTGFTDKIPFLKELTQKHTTAGATGARQRFGARRHATTRGEAGARPRRAYAAGAVRFSPGKESRVKKHGLPMAFLRNVVLTCAAVVIVSVIAIPTSFATPATRITVNDAGRVMEAETVAITVGEFLEDNMISIGADDVLEVDPSTPIREGMEILIRRAMPVTINTGGDNTMTINVVSGTVQDALDKAGVVPDEMDEVYPATDTFLRSGMKIEHIVVTTDTRVEVREIPYEEETVEDPKLAKGMTEIRQYGETGEYEIIFGQVFKNGMLMPEEIMSEQTIKEPVTEITALGTYVPPPPPKKKVTLSEMRKENSGGGGGDGGSGGGGGGGSNGWSDGAAGGTLPDGVSYSYSVGMSVTAYCSACNSGSSTSIGVAPSYGTVAAAASQFAFGTKLYIPGYGYGVVQDRGGFGAGVLDVYIGGRDSCTCGSEWGRKSLTVYVL